MRILVAMFRLPEILDGQQQMPQLFAQQQQQLDAATAPLPARFEELASQNAQLASQNAQLAQRLHIYETQQLPSVLQTLSDLNRRQISQDHDTGNLTKSVPVALRTLTRELRELPRLSERVAELAARLDALGPDPQPQLDALSGSVTYLLNRVEFVRKELLFEMRYGAHSPTGESRPETEKRVVEKEKFDRAKAAGELKLNLGCGHIPLDGYLNVDRRALPGVDIVAEIDDLPVAEGEVDEVHSAHLLEHFPQEQLRRELLPYWRGLIRAGGTFRAVVPDAQAMIHHYEAGTYPYDELREVIYGGQDYDGDFHFNMFTPQSLSTLLAEAGFEDVNVLESGRRNGACYEFEIVARR